MLRQSLIGLRPVPSARVATARRRRLHRLMLAGLLSAGFGLHADAMQPRVVITKTSNHVDKHGERRVHAAAQRKVEHLVHNGQIPPQVVRALQSATRQVNTDPFVLLAIAWQESRFDPHARNRQSSARGLLQFTNATWLTVIRDYGPRHGLTHLASAISTSPDGALRVRSRKLRKAILALRNDPTLEVLMAAERLAHEQNGLEGELGRAIDPADLYILHLLGPSGAREFLTELAKDPDQASTKVVGPAARVNTGLFVRDGRPLSVAAAYSNIRARLEDQAAAHGGLFADEE